MLHLPLNNTHFSGLLEGFEQAMRAKGFSGAKYYGSAVREFFFFLETKGIDLITEVKAKHVVAFYEYLRERPNDRRGGTLSDSSIRTYLLFIRLLFDHLIATKVLIASPIHLPRFAIANFKERSVATVEEIKLIYLATKNRRDRAILALAYGCGMRRSEIEKLDVSDIQFKEGTLVIREAKFGKTRRVPLSDTVIRDLREYLVNERPTMLSGQERLSPSLLLNRWGGRLRGVDICLRVKEMVQRTGNKNLIRKEITPHCLRHSIATHMIDKGASIDFVRRFLGHVFLDTTHIYSKKRKQKRILLEQLEHTGKAA
jgi:integrase/recombinase XerD